MGKVSPKYKNFLIIEDLHTQARDTSVKVFCHIYSFKHLIKEQTYYKNPINTKCTDLMITIKQRRFQNYCVNDTGFSDFHK